MKRLVDPSNNILFSIDIDDPDALTRLGSVNEQVDVEKTLEAIQEFTRYLHDMEEGLSRESKKLRNKETAQSAGFAAAGIHEALNYLAIVKKVIQKTQRVLHRKEAKTNLEVSEQNPIRESRTEKF